MVRKLTLAAGALGGLFATVGAWNLYQRYTTESVPYTTVANVGETELRRYPASVLVETVAPTQREAFQRLFRYIDGENEVDVDVSMTAPVKVDGGSQSIAMTAPVRIGGEDGRSLSMAAPVEAESEGEGVRMAFYLPQEYDFETAPRPTNDEVELVFLPERTLAVRSFSWRPTESRIDSEREALVESLQRAEIDIQGEPFYMGYDAPWTLPFLRRNEIAVSVQTEE